MARKPAPSLDAPAPAPRRAPTNDPRGQGSKPPTARDMAHAEVRRRILEVARRHLAEKGPGQLSLRAVIGDVGMVSSAIYRYFPSRDDLLTALLLESYGALGDALEARAAQAMQATQAPSRRPSDRFRDLADEFVTWARSHPHDFALMYGTPVPGYLAPPETIGAAARVVAPFVAVLLAAGAGGAGGFSGPEPDSPLPGALAAQARGFAEAAGLDLPERRVLAFFEVMAMLVGLVTLEIGGHFVGTFEPADDLAAYVVDGAARRLGLLA